MQKTMSEKPISSKCCCLPSTSATTSSSTTGYADLVSLFECPVCFEYVLPPILQCESGHLICSKCRPKLKLCPTCRRPFGNLRNLAMEKVASTVMIPCQYSSAGCTESLLLTEIAEHDEMCKFRTCLCPCPGGSCKWQGYLEDVMPHLMKSHKSVTILEGEEIVFLATDVNLPGSVDWVMIQSCFGYYFMLVLKKQHICEGYPQYFLVALLIGSRNQAKHFTHRMEVGGQGQHLTWESTPCSVYEGITSAIMECNCMVLNTRMVQLYAPNGNLAINVTISMK